MERSLQLQRELTEQRRAEGKSDFICQGTLEIYDAGGLSFSQIHVGGLRMLSRVLGLGAAHYPENLGEAERLYKNLPFTTAFFIKARRCYIYHYRYISL